MADLQISALPAIAEANVQATDVLALADLSATETKKVTVKDLVAAAVALLDSGDIPAAKVATPFAADAVATATIQNLAVTTAKIANGAITATQITDATITGAKLVNDTVTATQIAANAIGSSELADDAVDTAAIANLAVTNAKIANTTIAYGKLNLSDGDIPGAKLTSASVTATQLATNSVTATELADNAVDTAAVASGAITGAKIANNTIVAGNIANGAVGSTQIANGAIGTDQIANNAVTTDKLSGTISAGTITDGAVGTAKLADDAVDSSKLAANAVDATALADNAVDSGAIASNAVTEAKIAANAVVNAKIADGTITAAKLNTSNIDRSLNVASGNLGINNTVTAATRSGITYNAQGLITGTVALAASDLPLATTSAVGGVSVGTGLSVSGAGALSLTNSVTGATVSGITFNAQGMITAATALVASDLPVATTSAKGAVQITSGGGLTVDGSGNLSTSTSGISAGTYQSITVNNKGVATAGAALTAGLIPDLAASKITSGSFDAARIANDSIDGTKLSNASTAVFQSIAQSGYPTAQFSGQILFDTVSEDAFIWDGNAWQAITTLTKGSLVFGGTYNANTSQMVAATSAGIAAGLAVGSNLPTASATTDGVYVVVATSGTPASPAPAIAFAPPDYILGVTNSAGSSWNEVDLSQTVAGQVASNITFTPYGQISATNVQDALQELETEKLALSGGTVTGQVLIGNTGSLVFEGSTIDAYETTITVADPTSSDKTITFPDTTGTVITTGDTNTVTSTMVDASLVNANLAANAAIAFTKLAALTSAQILVGNASNEVAAVAVTGDISINNAGLTAIAAGVIVNADISGSAQITGSKVVTGTTSAVGVLQLTDSAASTSATTAATPAAVKIAKDAADAAATTANAALPKAGGTMTDNLIIDNGKELRLSESDSDGANYTGLKAQAQSGDITLTLPAVAPTAGQVLKADASTPTTLTWAADSATDSTKMPLAGGTFTGDVTFTGDSSNGLWDKSASAFVADLTGTASIATSITVADESSDTTCNVLFATGATGNLAPKSGTNLTFNSSSGALTATSFVGALTGDVTGNVSGSAATVTGAAQSAITSLGTLTGLTVDGDVTFTGASSNGSWDKSANAFVGNLTGTASNNAVLTGSTNNTIATVTGANALQGEANLTFDGSELKLPTGSGTQGLFFQASSGSNANLRGVGTNYGELGFFIGNSEKFRLDSSGRLLLGTSTGRIINSHEPRLQITGTTYSHATVSIVSNTNGSDGSYLFFAKQRSGAVGGSTVVQDGDSIGELRFAGGDGTDCESIAAQIFVQVDGTPGSNDMPGRLVFSTTADGAAAATERMRIDSSGDLMLGAVGQYNDITGHGGGLLIGPGTGSDSGIMLRSSSSGVGRIYFGDNSANDNGRKDGFIVYSQTARTLSLGTAQTERYLIGSAGQFGIAGANYGSSGQVLTSGGASTAPSWQDAGGGGGTVELTANGAIPANTPVVVRSDGDAEIVFQSTTLNTTLGTAGNTYAGNTSDVAFCYDVAGTRWICVYGDVHNTNGYVFWTPTNTSGVWSNSHNYVYQGAIAACDAYHDATTGAVIAFYSVTAGSNRGRGVVLYSNNSNQTGSACEFFEQCNFFGWERDPENGRLVGHLQRQQSTPYLNVLQMLTVNTDNSMTDNGEITVTTDATPYGGLTVGAGFVLLSYVKENNYVYVKAYKWNSSSSSYTASSEVQASSNTSDFNDVCFNTDSSKFVVITRDTANNDALKGRVVTITESGGTPSITLGTEVTSGETGVSRPSLYYDPEIKQIVCAMVGGISTAARAKVRRITISGTTVTFQTATDLTTSQVWATGKTLTATGFGDGKCMVGWHQNPSQTWARTVALGGTSTNITAGNFVGFSGDSATADNGTCTINVVGNTTTQSSLTPGQKYYVTNAGDLSTTAQTPSVEAGIAIAANKLLIK